MDRGKMNVPTVLGIIFIVFMVGAATADIGNLIVVEVGETYTWQLPFGVLFLMTVPFVLGYIGGKDD